MVSNSDYTGASQEVFSQIPTLQLLKLYKYLDWADKKLHSIFFLESKDQIEEDLLHDFKEADGSRVKTGAA